MAESRTVVIGIGNAYRSDDAVGLHVAEQIRVLGLEGVTVIKGIGDGFAVVDAWSDFDRAFVIDCASSGAAPGTIFRFDALRETIPCELFSGLSTHSIAVNDAVALARLLGRLPAGLVVYGIEGENLSAGVELTPAVRRSAHRIARCIVEEIQAQAEA